MAEKYDVVVAGAGIAGCLMARDLAKLGRKVALLDRRPRARLGHDWWDSVAVEVFDEVGLPAPEPPELMNPANEMAVYSPLETKETLIPENTTKANIDRRLFADRLLKYAVEAGADFFGETAVLGPVTDNSTVVGLAARDKNNPEIKFNAKITIDATGMSAALRKNTSGGYGFTRYIDRSDMFITHREIRKNTDGSHRSEMTFGKNNGVTWVNRGQEGLVDVFAGVINFPGRRVPRELVAEIIGKENGIGGEIIRGGGAPIPVRRCFDSFVAPGLILCGDSACQCNPIDGSGIASSLRAARFAAAAVNAALENGRTDVEALWPYNSAYKRTEGAKFAALHLVQKFMVSEPKTNLETLFRRGVINPKIFWGTGSAQDPDSKIQMILKLLKIADRPLLIMRLIKMVKSSQDIEEQYKNFPEKYSAAEFDSWRRGVEDIFSRIPKPYGIAM